VSDPEKQAAADTAEKQPPPTEAEAKPSSRKKGPDPLIGRVINDRFRVVSLLARGGMGKVYRAEQAPLGREVALKILNPNYHGDHDPEFHKRFFLEASICSKLTHPNTVTIFDYGRTEDDVYYIAMELLEGRTLHRALREETRIAPERAMHVARQVCRSLREAHSLGVIHRDLKPANIFLVKHGDESDFVKVLDFGLVKDLGEKGEDLTQTGLFMGSPKYMSPEQIRGDDVDGRADVYALGVILYEMLTGKVPFDRPNSVNILMAHVHEAPPSLLEAAPDAGIDPTLEQVVLRAMAKVPDERFASMDEFLVALKRVASASGLAVSRSGETALSGEFAISGGSTGSFPVQVTGSPHTPNSSSSSLTPAIAAPSDDLLTTSGSELTAGQQSNQAKVFIGVVLLAAAAVGGYLALSGGGDETEEIAQNATPEPPDTAPTMETSMEATMVAEPANEHVLVALRSDPPGATVVVGDREYGPTPANVELRGEQVTPGTELTFQFRLEGHRDFTVTRTIVSEELTIRATLDRIAEEETPAAMVRRPPRPRTPRMTSMTSMESGGPAVGLKGYKAEPY